MIRTKSYSKRKALVAFAVAAIMSVTGIYAGVVKEDALAEETETTIDADYCYQEGYEVSVDLGAEGSVLLKNENNCLPLAEGTKVTILGSMSYNYVEGGTGSAGGKDDENTVMMNDAFEEAGLDVNDTAWDWLANRCGGSRGSGNAPDGTEWTSYTGIHEFTVSQYEGSSSTILQSGYTDYAIVTFSRSGAEGASPSMDMDGDGSTLTGTTYLELNENEKDLLKWCKANFKHTIVLINSATAMELGFLDETEYGVDACLWIGHPGEAGIVGVGTLLTGRNTPSGSLVDTYGYDMSTNPTYYNTDGNSYTTGQTYYQYEEGIYVGYRYYETAAAEGYFDSTTFSSISFKNGKVSGYDEVVQFPFGYGLSYTTFSQQIVDSDIDLSAHSTNSVTVKVTNTGDVSGKEIVQLYMEAPYNQDSSLGISGKGLEKAKVVLVGYTKTEELDPGESTEVEIEFDTDNLASYDNFGQGCYVLEKGTYYFNIQDNAHCWSQDSTADNAVYDSVSKNVASTIIYNDKSGNAGSRSSDSTTATNALDDVTAGDGCMLDGYLSRSDFAGGMAEIMKHESNCRSETPSDEVTAALNVTGTNTYTYTYQTYINGVKTRLSSTIYSHGGNMMPFATSTPSGISVSSYEVPLWGQSYYVLEDENGDVIIDSDGYFTVYDEEPTDGSAYHKLCVDDMETIPIDTDKGMAIWEKLTEETTLDEAIEIQGNSGWQVSAVSSVGKAAQTTVDGPGEPGNGSYNGATWFPCAVTIASTWNNDLANAEGVAYGNQCQLFGIGGAYAPAMNIHRSPFGGRNFEYYSEDGFISGNIGGSASAGIMSTGTNVFIKHFALNDGDTNRGGNTTWANEQAIREIYLYTYEIACKEYGANGIMGSLNRIGLSWFHYGMYSTILRSEWGWEGFLITDGDGSDGDTYNNAQAMMCVEGSMLSRGCYINANSTVAAYGDATQYTYSQVMLHNNMRHCLYQYAYGGAGATTEGETNFAPIIIGVVCGVVAVGVIAGVSVAVVKIRKKKKA